MADADAPYVFLSYASADRERSLAIADTLEAAGVHVWVDRRAIVGGSSWDAEIVRGIKGCGALLVACTPAAMDSVNVQQEIRLALEERRPIVPLLLEPVTFPDQVRYALAGRQWVELLDRPTEAWLPDVRRSLSALGIAPASAGARPPPVTPASPGASEPPSSATTTNLPTSLTTFVGREGEIADIVGLLASNRLVTLTGPGGTGKTRLAIAVAEQVKDRHPDGVWFVDLSPLSDPTLVTSAIAQVLGVREGEGRSLAEALKAYLREKRLLLLLDNFEQVVGAATAVSDLLAYTSRMTALVTSRVLLRVDGEAEYAVPPLALPEVDAGTSLDALADTAAVALFVQRARAAKPGLSLTVENAAAVADICRRLDGLPLALEPAASRLRVLSVAALRERLDQRLTILTGGACSLPQRQQTLRDTVAWSYDLLTSDERALFRRLGVFAGGWTLEAAEAVCDAHGDLGIDTLDGLSSLVEKSLVGRTDGADGEPRFGMLSTIREYALERLAEAGEAEATRARHAAAFVALAERAEPSLRSADHAAWEARLDAERDNLRAVVAWAREGDPASGLRLVGALHTLWNYRALAAEARPWTEDLLARPGVDPRGGPGLDAGRPPRGDAPRRRERGALARAG